MLQIFIGAKGVMNKPTITHDYYYGHEAEQYTFYRLPKALFTDSRYKHLSDGAKILYGLMLDRMGLSAKNGWLDDNGRVYIFFTLDDIIEYMNCGQDKGVKLLAELDADKGIGLIERVKQGQGKPARIYVKKFTGSAESLTSEKPKSALRVDSVELLTSEKPKSAPRKSRSQDFGKTECNNTDKNKTEYINTENLSIHPASEPKASGPSQSIVMERMDEMNVIREQIRTNIGYYVLIGQYGAERLDGIVELMTESVCSTQSVFRIGGGEYSREEVKRRLLSIRSLEIQYVFECMDENAPRVKNIKSYLLSALFNAPVTMDAYYRAKANDFLNGPRP